MNTMRWEDIIRGLPITCTDSEISEFEKTFGVELPQDFRNFLKVFNGGTAMFGNTIDCDLDNDEIELSFIYPLVSEMNEYSGGISGLCRRWQLEGWNLKGCVPFGDNNGGGYFFLVLFGESQGAVFYADAEEFFGECFDEIATNETRIPVCFIKVSDSFDSLRSKIIRD